MRTPTTHPLSRLACGILTSLLLAAAAGAQTVWNLATDFSLAANPNGAWTYQMEVTPGDDDTAYTPIADNTIHANTIWGTTFATPPVMRTEGTGFWGIGRNDTGATQTSNAVTWAPGEVLFHPKPGFAGSGGRFVITWQAPANMSVDVAWAYAKRMTIGTDGVGMSVLHESGGANTQLRAFGNPEGATGTFDNLAVTTGDKLHFRFDNWVDAGGDITWGDITVTQLSAPGPSIASFTSNPGVVAAAGAPVTFDWQVGGLPLDSLVITPGNIDVLPLTNASGMGSYALNPAPGVNTEYTLTAIKGAVTRQRKVFVIVRIVDPNAIFSGDFESFTAPAGNFNGGQFQSGLVVAHSGNVTGWTKAGGGTVHVVDRANLVGGTNPRDFSVMIWQDNVITQAAAVSGSNASGAAYAVGFDAGPAVYQAPSQQTGATDGILIEVLRADGSVLATHTHLPGVWAGYPALAGGSFQYIGDGSGDVRLRIGPSAPGSGRFGGTIDNVSIAPATTAPIEFISISRNPATGAVTFTFTSVNGVNYEVWATSNLANPPAAWEQLDDEVVGTGNSTPFTDSVLAPTNSRLFYQVRRP